MKICLDTLRPNCWPVHTCGPQGQGRAHWKALGKSLALQIIPLSLLLLPLFPGHEGQAGPNEPEKVQGGTTPGKSPKHCPRSSAWSSLPASRAGEDSREETPYCSLSKARLCFFSPFTQELLSGKAVHHSTLAGHLFCFLSWGRNKGQGEGSGHLRV